MWSVNCSWFSHGSVRRAAPKTAQNGLLTLTVRRRDVRSMSNLVCMMVGTLVVLW